MKKFLGKKNVMIAFVALAVLFLAVYVGMLVRPVSYGFNYTNSIVSEDDGKELEEITKLNFRSDKVLRQTAISTIDGEVDEKGVGDFWIYRDGNKIIIIGLKEVIESTEMSKSQIEDYNKNAMSKAKYEVEVEELEKLKEESPKAYELRMKSALEVKLFTAGEDDPETKDLDESFGNTQAVVFTVVHGVVTVALLAFASLSLVFFVTKKK